MRVATLVCIASVPLAFLSACGLFSPDGTAPARSKDKTWSLSSVAAEQACREGSQTFTKSLAPPRGGALPVRLSDHVPKSVDVQDWRPAFTSALSPNAPSGSVPGASSWRRGYAVTFNGTRPGGFTLYVLEYAQPDEAIAEAAAYHQDLVCTRGLDAFVVDGHPGIAVSMSAILYTATWIHGSRRLEVRSQFFGDERTDSRNALLATEASWNAS